MLSDWGWVSGERVAETEVEEEICWRGGIGGMLY